MDIISAPDGAPIEVTPELIQSWKDMKVAICLDMGKGEDLWIVSEYTDADRLEMTIEDFVIRSSLVNEIKNVFPDAKIESIKKYKDAPKL